MKRKALLNGILEWALELAVTVTICLIIIEFVAQIAFVHKNSMLPTIRSNNVLIVEKLSAEFKKFKRGDIVIVDNIYANDEYDILIKRVIGLEGDLIQIKEDGKVYVNGQMLNEKYTNGSVTKPVEMKYNNYVVPEGSVYVLGDNRLLGGSLDSRTFGAVSKETIKGKAVFRIFPLTEIGIIK